MKERKITLEDLKNKVAHRNSEISDEALGDVNGGFFETRGGYSQNTYVWCPRCGYDQTMEGEVDTGAGVDWFWCPRCRDWFADDGRSVWY